MGKALNIPVEVHPELREYAIGEWEDLPFRHLYNEFDFVNLARTDLDFAPPGGESLRQVSARMVPAIHEVHERHVNHTDEKILLVSHGAALAVALATLLEADPAEWVNYHFANCGLTELVLKPQPYVNFFNFTLHL